MFEATFIGFDAGPDHLDLRGLPILMDPEDHDGVRIAVENLAGDLEKVTGSRPAVWASANDGVAQGAIVVGSLAKSRLITELTEVGKYDASGISGKWESFQTSIVTESPWPSVKRLLVITGSDKRGTIFGVYTLSEQLGVSPWYWWADVPIEPHNHVYALPVTTQHGEPSVRYRGLFINDESPGLTDWVHNNFGPVYNSEFYVKVFELLLRMKANFLWPAMWSGYPWPGSSFFLDDPLNQQLAHKHGIIMSTSHHEPMQRSTTEWRRDPKGDYSWETNKEALKEFFTVGAERARPYESMLTLGMRGVGDEGIDAEDALGTMGSVIQHQRRIIENTYGKPDGVGQVLALYKEVQELYDQGLDVPEDITLLFADDNFGNLRRLPTEEERGRSGGCGIYYHLEYVGHPRSYKWLNSNSLGKIEQQLRHAHQGGIQQIWVINVGDIKPMEVPLTFAMTLAWNINAVGPTTLPLFFLSYSAREFHLKFTQDIAELLRGHDGLMALRRHEHIEASTFSVLNYREAESVLHRYKDLEMHASALLDVLPPSYRSAFFQIVLHPIKASRIYTELRIAQAKNRHFGLQRRNTTNTMLQRVADLLDEDFSLSELYHNSPWQGRKWDCIVSQPHYGYSDDTWHAPSRDLITGLSMVQQRQNSTRIAGYMGVAVEGHGGVRPGLSCEEIDRTHPSRNDLVPGLTLQVLSPYSPLTRYFEIYTRGTKVLQWTVSASDKWIRISPPTGLSSPDDKEDQRIELTVDWNSAPRGYQGIIYLEIRTDVGDYERVHLPIDHRQIPDTFQAGFVESEGVVSIEAASVPLTDHQRKFYQHFAHLGRTASGAIGLTQADLGTPPCLEFPVYLFSHPGDVEVTLYFTMALDVNEDKPMRYDISLDDLIHESVRLLEVKGKGTMPVGWATAVQDGVWTRKISFCGIGSGSHMLRYRPLSPGLNLEKLVVDAGSLQESYLGPPPSFSIGYT